MEERMNRIYYNLTKIADGWLLNYAPTFPYPDTMSPDSLQRFFETFDKAYEFINQHMDRIEKFDGTSLRPLFRKAK